ncbi:hypothetical protein KAE78_06880 [Microbacterium sp. NIBRBAC000506063]|nr:hypothetical protein [Microbacterium sp. NIBRBAC000506063]QTV80573.1 hypothetical protein KAE78_06880 [Microbacterium sp. NIBRBAC000506063]
MNAEHFSSTTKLVRGVRDSIRPGDSVLFKAAGAGKFGPKVVYPLFGRVV